VTLHASKDNTIYSESDDRSNGAGQYFFSGRNSTGNYRRALLAFDIAAAVPAGSTIDSVVLELYVSRTSSGVSGVDLFRVLTGWGEGTSVAAGNEGGGAIATDGDATWRYPFYNIEDPKAAPFWNTLGGDFAAIASAGTGVGGIGFYTWGSNPSIVADVQAWLDVPQSNFGWVLIGDEGPFRSTKRFSSRTSFGGGGARR